MKLLRTLTVVVSMVVLLLASGCSSGTAREPGANDTEPSQPLPLVPFGPDGFLSWDDTSGLTVLDSSGHPVAQTATPGFTVQTCAASSAAAKAAVLLAPSEPTSTETRLVGLFENAGAESHLTTVTVLQVADADSPSLALADDGQSLAVFHLPSSDRPAAVGEVCAELLAPSGDRIWTSEADPARPLTAWATAADLRIVALARTDLTDGSTTVEVLWDGNLIHELTLDDPCVLAVSPRGDRIAVGVNGDDSASITLYAATPGYTAQWVHPTPAVSALQFDQSGTYLVAHGLRGERAYANNTDLGQTLHSRVDVLDESGNVWWQSEVTGEGPWVASMMPFGGGFAFFPPNAPDDRPASVLSLTADAPRPIELPGHYLNIGVTRDGRAALGQRKDGGLEPQELR